MIEAAFAPAAAAVASGRIPGATLGVITADGTRHVRVAGLAQKVPAEEPLTRAHWFDLASVSKVVATTSFVLRLADEGRIDLDRPLTDAIPDLRQYDVAGAAERRLTFRDCLVHRTFLPAVEPIYTYGDDPDRLRAFVLQREWRHGPPVYSDINFILLGIAVERITGAGLDALPLGEGLGWGPPPGPAVATERCAWRGRVLKGEVHDENCFAMGGRTGHAGLFGTVDGVLDFVAGLLDGSGASPAMLAAIRTPVEGHRTAGWEIRFPGWSGGQACSPATIGHTGFTGTGLWIDFDRGLAWTLLTNRVHPTRHADSGIFDLRPATGDAVAAAFHRGGHPAMSVNRVVPNIATQDMAAARAFYGDLLGMTVGMDHGWIVTFVGSGKAVPQVSFATEGGSGTPVPDLSIEVDDVDAVLARVAQAGHTIAYGPADEPWGVRRFFVRDPFGRLLNILSHR